MRWLKAPEGTAAFHLPSRPLLGCVRGYLVRDTSALTGPDRVERRNHYPASPYVSLIWLLEGQSICVAPPDIAGRSLPRVTLLGPQRRPWSTRNPGAVRSFGIVFAPGALSRLAGLDMATLVDRAAPVHHHFNAEWLAWCEAVSAAPDDATRLRLVEDFLTRAWRERAGGSWHDTSAARSARSIARRVKALMGIGPREQQVLKRVEHTLVSAHAHAAAEAGEWADVAAQGGYSDQAHLCRHTRRATGLSPGELARRARTDAGYWLYRVWRGEQGLDADGRP